MKESSAPLAKVVVEVIPFPLPIDNGEALLTPHPAIEYFRLPMNVRAFPSKGFNVEHALDSLCSPKSVGLESNDVFSSPYDRVLILLGGDASLVVLDFLNKDEDGYIAIRGRKKKQNASPPQGHKGVTTRKKKSYCGSKHWGQWRPSSQKSRERECKKYIAEGVQKNLFYLCSKSTPSSCK